MNKNLEAPKLKIVFAEDCGKPIIVDGSFGGNKLSNLILDAGRHIRALGIILLLAKDRGDRCAKNDFLTFQPEVPGSTCVHSLGKYLQNLGNTRKVWFNSVFRTGLFFLSGDRGARHSGGTAHAKVEFNIKMISTENLQFFRRDRNSQSAILIPLDTSEKIRNFALELEQYLGPWCKNKCVQVIIDETDKLLKTLTHTGNGTSKTSKDFVTERSHEDIAAELYYRLRLAEGEREAISLIEQHTCKNPDICNTSFPPHGDFPLLLAIATQKKDLINYLLSHGQIRVNQSNGKGVTSLLKAASLNDIELIEQLLVKKANAKARNVKYANAIYEAAFGATLLSCETIKLFEKCGVNCNDISGDGFLPLAVAIWRHCPDDTIEHLLKKTRELDQADKYGESLVYKAFKHRDFETMVKLIKMLRSRGKDWGRTPRMSPENRGTELFRATHRGDVARVEAILNNVSKPFNIDHGEDVFERSPLHESVENRHIIITDLLLQRGANPFRTNNHGRTPRDLVPHDTNSHKDDASRYIEKLLIEAEQSLVKRDYAKSATI